MRLKLPGVVVALGAVSFFTDLSSEMIYPLLPAFLSGVLGAGAAALGLIEGVAESTAAALKVVSGWWSDRTGRRRPLVLFGYSLSGAARPLIGLAAAWHAVLLLRFVDRVGKGLRTSPRDALIADSTAPEFRARAYGFHRAMDHAGAVAGPLVAAALMAAGGLDMRQVFLWAAVPSLLAVATLAAFVREPRPTARSSPRPTDPPAAPAPDFTRFLVVLLLFTLGNSTDAFLLLRLGQAGLSPAGVAALWSGFHVVKMAAATGFGWWSDRWGHRRMIIAGWLVYAAVYLGFAVLDRPEGLVVAFLGYGVYFGMTEPSEKALVSLMAGGRQGRAFGWYHGVVGLGALPASVLFGLVWSGWGAAAAFALGAALALAAALGLAVFVPERSLPPPKDLEK